MYVYIRMNLCRTTSQSNEGVDMHVAIGVYLIEHDKQVESVVAPLFETMYVGCLRQVMFLFPIS